MRSAKGIAPEQINDAAIEAFIAEVRNGTLHRKPNDLHRKVALIWNEVAQRSELGLQPVTVPSFRSPAKRIDWKLLPSTFRKDLHDYSPGAPAIRSRPTPVHARWRRGPSSCARIRFTRPPPHSWRAASPRCHHIFGRPRLSRKFQTNFAASPRNGWRPRKCVQPRPRQNSRRDRASMGQSRCGDASGTEAARQQGSDAACGPNRKEQARPATIR